MNDRERIEALMGTIGAFEPGTVSLVGAGPGDSALVSVRGAARLVQADVVLHDHLIGPELLDLPAPEAERILVGKWRGAHVWTQDEINAALVEQARAGKRVVRLKGGDPFVFGRGGEECAYLAAAGVRYEVVPGITAAFGAPAAAGIPLTHRGLSRSFALVTGHADPGDPEPLDFAALARMETIVLYMGMKNLAENCDRLVEAGLDARTPAAVIRWGTRPEQRTVVGTVGDIADRVAQGAITPPALILIGGVVRLRESIEWFERRPLHGRTVVVTRAKDQAAGLTGPLLAAGAEVLEAPTLALGEVDDYGPVDAALRSAGPGGAYNWLVITSANGVDAMFARLRAMGRDSRALAGVRVAAVGPATAARLRAGGIEPDLVPAEAVGEALAREMIAQGGAQDTRVLLLRADIARPELPDALRQAGAECDDLPVYRTACPEALPVAFLDRFDAGTIHWLTFTSPSSFANLVSLLGQKGTVPNSPGSAGDDQLSGVGPESPSGRNGDSPRAADSRSKMPETDRLARLRRIKLASIGPVTTDSIRRAGYTEAAEAERHDAAGLVEAIVAAERR